MKKALGRNKGIGLFHNYCKAHTLPKCWEMLGAD